MSTQQALALPSPPPSNTEFINTRCSLRIEADQHVIVVAGLPVHHYRAEDAVAEAYTMVFLVQSGYAQQTDVARAFAPELMEQRSTVVSCDTLWRFLKREDISFKKKRSRQRAGSP